MQDLIFKQKQQNTADQRHKFLAATFIGWISSINQFICDIGP